MTQLKNKLIKGELFVFQASVHSFLYVVGLIILYLGIVSLNQSADSFSLLVQWLARGVIAIGIVILVVTFVIRYNTTLILTSKRVIAKQILIKKRELNVDILQIKKISIKQNPVCSCLNFGSIIIETNNEVMKIYFVRSPNDFKKIFQESFKLLKRI